MESQEHWKYMRKMWRAHKIKYPIDFATKRLKMAIHKIKTHELNALINKP